MDEESGRAFDQPAEEGRKAAVDREGFLWLFFSRVFRVPAYGIENDVRVDEFDARLEFYGIQKIAVFKIQRLRLPAVSGKLLRQRLAQKAVSAKNAFFLQFFPDVVRSGHLYILQTPLFRVRNKKETRYCYSDAEREKAIKQLGPKPEITRFKGLGEISPDEFGGFIGKDIRLEPVRMTKQDPIGTILSYYMGKNTNERQDFIIDNLYVEKDEI